MSKECKNTFVMNPNGFDKIIRIDRTCIDPHRRKPYPIPEHLKFRIHRRDD